MSENSKGSVILIEIHPRKLKQYFYSRFFSLGSRSYPVVEASYQDGQKVSSMTSPISVTATEATQHPQHRAIESHPTTHQSPRNKDPGCLLAWRKEKSTQGNRHNRKRRSKENTRRTTPLAFRKSSNHSSLLRIWQMVIRRCCCS